MAQGAWAASRPCPAAAARWSRNSVASPADSNGAEELGWRCRPGPWQWRAGAVVPAAAHSSQVGASLGTRGSWGWEEKFESLPTLGTQIGTLLGRVFFTLSPYFKSRDSSRVSAGVAHQRIIGL